MELNEPTKLDFLFVYQPKIFSLSFCSFELYSFRVISCLGGKKSQKISSFTELKDYFSLSIIQKKLIIFRELGEFAMTSQSEFRGFTGRFFHSKLYLSNF